MQSAGRDGLRAVVLATAVLAFAGLAVGQAVQVHHHLGSGLYEYGGVRDQ